MFLFIHIRIIDIIDIFLVAFLLYQFYSLIRGTIAINIFIAIFAIYLIWMITKALNMQLLSSILGQVIGIGIIGIIIIFHEEIKRFLILIGTRYFTRKFSIQNVLIGKTYSPRVETKEIARAVVNLSKKKTGALLVIERNIPLHLYGETGEILNANTNSSLLESIFFKNNPLHDGAVIIIKDKIFAARCMLPMSQNPNIPAELGMRHRAGLGMSEQNDSFVIIISEETGNVAIAENATLTTNITLKGLVKKLNDVFGHY